MYCRAVKQRISPVVILENSLPQTNLLPEKAVSFCQVSLPPPGHGTSVPRAGRDQSSRECQRAMLMHIGAGADTK